MSVTLEEYYARTAAKMFNMVDGDDDAEEFFKSMKKFVNLPEIAEAEEKYRRITEDKKYPLVYNYREWIRNLLPINGKIMKTLEEMYPDQIINANEFKKVYYETMKNNYPFLHPKCIDYFYSESKQQVLFSYNWGVYKQVYQFDENCFDYLLNNTTYDKIPVEILAKNLPFKLFAINNSFEIGEFNKSW